MGKGVSETRSEEPLKSFFLFLASLWLRLCLWHKEGAVAEAHDDDDDDDGVVAVVAAATSCGVIVNYP